MPDKFILNINDDFYISPSYLTFDSACRSIEGLLTDKNNWKYGYGKYKQGGFRVKYKDGSLDNIIILAQRRGNSLKGVFWFANEFSKFSAIGKTHYAYYLFEGSMDKDGLHEGDVASYEIIGNNIFNNKRTIIGTITFPGIFSGEIKSNTGKETLAQF